MEFLKNLREKLSNMDTNTFLASLVSTIGALSTSDITQIIYVISAITAQIFAMYLSYKKENILRNQLLEDIELKKEERRSLSLKNDSEEKRIKKEYE